MTTISNARARTSNSRPRLLIHSPSSIQNPPTLFIQLTSRPMSASCVTSSRLSIHATHRQKSTSCATTNLPPPSLPDRLRHLLAPFLPHCSLPSVSPTCSPPSFLTPHFPPPSPLACPFLPHCSLPSASPPPPPSPLVYSLASLLRSRPLAIVKNQASKDLRGGIRTRPDFHVEGMRAVQVEVGVVRTVPVPHGDGPPIPWQPLTCSPGPQGPPISSHVTLHPLCHVRALHGRGDLDSYALHPMSVLHCHHRRHCCRHQHHRHFLPP